MVKVIIVSWSCVSVWRQAVCRGRQYVGGASRHKPTHRDQTKEARRVKREYANNEFGLAVEKKIEEIELQHSTAVHRVQRDHACDAQGARRSVGGSHALRFAPTESVGVLFSANAPLFHSLSAAKDMTIIIRLLQHSHGQPD